MGRVMLSNALAATLLFISFDALLFLTDISDDHPLMVRPSTTEHNETYRNLFILYIIYVNRILNVSEIIFLKRRQNNSFSYHYYKIAYFIFLKFLSTKINFSNQFTSFFKFYCRYQHSISASWCLDSGLCMLF